MKTLQMQKTRWCAWAAAALLLGAANIAQAQWVQGPVNVNGTIHSEDPGVSVSVWTDPLASGGLNFAPAGSTSTNPLNTTAGSFQVSIDPTAVGVPANTNFTAYCVDLGAYTTSFQPAQFGTANGMVADQSGNTRNIGAASWVVNNYTESDLVDNYSLTTAQAGAALQLAIWKAAYDWTSTNITDSNASKLWFTGDVTSVASGNLFSAVQGIINALGNNTSDAYFLQFNGTTVTNQDMIAFNPSPQEISGVPIPAALFFVAPALLGVLGGMRRKPQGMMA